MTPDRRTFLTFATTGTAAFALFGCRDADAGAPERFAYVLTDAQWKQKLSPAAYEVLRHENTERPGSSPLNNEHRTGTFSCAGCGQANYSSKTKFDSGTGWPSFWKPLPGAVRGRLVGLHANGGTLQPLRRSSRPRVRRRAAADWPALLHERRGAELQTRRRIEIRKRRCRRSWCRRWPSSSARAAPVRLRCDRHR